MIPIQGIIGIAGALVVFGAWYFISAKWKPKPKQEEAQAETVATVQAEPDSKLDELASILGGNGHSHETQQQIRQVLVEENIRAQSAVAVADMADQLLIRWPVRELKPTDKKYRAMVFTREKPNIRFKDIPVPLGNQVELDPSMPEHGPHYAVTELPDDKGKMWWEVYDPRNDPVIGDQTPSDAFDAVDIHDRVSDCWKDKLTLLETIKTILAVIFFVGLFIVALEGLSKLGGH